MSNAEIPKYGKSGIAFLGTEIKHAYIFIIFCVIGAFAGSAGHMEWKGYILIPGAGLYLNKKYVYWVSSQIPGFFNALMYHFGFSGYSKAFSVQKRVFIGDPVVRNLANNEVDDGA